MKDKEIKIHEVDDEAYINLLIDFIHCWWEDETDTINYINTVMYNDYLEWKALPGKAEKYKNIIKDFDKDFLNKFTGFNSYKLVRNNKEKE